MNTIKSQTIAIAVIFTGALMSASSTFAGASLVKACKDDLKKFSCNAKTDAKAHECLEKNEKKDEENQGLSSSCYAAHEAFEKNAEHSEHKENGAEHKH